MKLKATRQDTKDMFMALLRAYPYIIKYKIEIKEYDIKKSTIVLTANSKRPTDPKELKAGENAIKDYTTAKYGCETKDINGSAMIEGVKIASRDNLTEEDILRTIDKFFNIKSN